MAKLRHFLDIDQFDKAVLSYMPTVPLTYVAARKCETLNLLFNWTAVPVPAVLLAVSFHSAYSWAPNIMSRMRYELMPLLRVRFISFCSRPAKVFLPMPYAVLIVLLGRLNTIGTHSRGHLFYLPMSWQSGAVKHFPCLAGSRCPNLHLPSMPTPQCSKW